MMSETCATSSRAATRGMMFLPTVVAVATTWPWPAACLAISGARFSARGCSYSAESTFTTFDTPATLAAASAAGPQSLPATRTTTWSLISAAAATACSVEGRRAPFSCSAKTSALMSDHLRFVLQLRHQLGHVGHLHAALALGRLHHLQGGEARRRVDTEVGWRRLVDRLLLRLHDVRQRSVARLVQAQVGGDDRRRLDGDGLQPAVDLPGHGEGTVADLDLRGEGRLAPAEQGREHLAGLVAVVVDRLLAEDHDAGLLLLDDRLQHLGDRQRLDLAVEHDVDAAVGSHRQRGADGLLRLARPDRDGHDFLGLAGLLHAEDRKSTRLNSSH